MADAERIALLDVLITEHRDRRTTLQGRIASIQTTIGAIATGLAALGALLAPRLPYDRFQGVDKVLLGISAAAAFAVVVIWVDAIGGPTKGSLVQWRRDDEAAAVAYEEVWPSLDPVEVRSALLERLRSEEALARRELVPRQESLRMTAWAAITALTVISVLAIRLAT